MSIDNIDFRCEGRRLEIGLFAGEDCVDVIKLTRAEAMTLLGALTAAIAQHEDAYKPRQEGLPL